MLAFGNGIGLAKVTSEFERIISPLPLEAICMGLCKGGSYEDQ
jgi:hypothetical protein